jgi:hypothetical protein
MVVLDHFPKRMDLMIWSEAYFYAGTLCHISWLSAGIFVPFWVHIGVPKQPQKVEKNIKNLFSGCFKKNGPNDLVRNLIL